MAGSSLALSIWRFVKWSKKKAKKDTQTMPPDPWDFSITDLAYDPEKEYAKAVEDAKKFQDDRSATKKEEGKEKGKGLWVFGGLWKVDHRKKLNEGDSHLMEKAKRRSRRSMSGPLERWQENINRKCVHRENKSGPIYSDGMSVGPQNKMNTSSQDLPFYKDNESPYEQLRRPQRPFVYPIYSV